ncbi:hypothetical protein Acsp03_54380 [Actinomadura sp. NBRC 104412]|uniref:hypothetical protein n=1 Tax=Actinomadura sp. NBRC 104412 TaxID=3032203 RepID=UPI0024A0FA3C|nr:hypothetical protein [Actinomadura sp. NBRC 104412]GLZ07972.1 hypothetical protein Acsp03_54380 [Actinomadura sp. NBRC 104412]
MPDIPQSSSIDPQRVRERNLAAREIVAQLADAMETIDDLWLRLHAALSDTPVLLTEINRLNVELIKARFNLSNLVAAARATLKAHREDEPDALYYVRDELRAQGQLPPEWWELP